MATSPVGGMVVQKSQQERVQQRECVNIYCMCMCVLSLKTYGHVWQILHAHTQTDPLLYVSTNILTLKASAGVSETDRKKEGWVDTAEVDTGKWSERKKKKRVTKKKMRTEEWRERGERNDNDGGIKG